tara:strand:+ start:825 stop:1847 length:1023 start_codon:yes stop_codon:yes gene_type:complete
MKKTEIDEFSIEMLKEMQKESGVSNSKRLISILMRKLELLEEKISDLEENIPKKSALASGGDFWDDKAATSGIVPFAISGISDQHAKELFSEMGECINQRIEQLKESNNEGRSCISCNKSLVRSDGTIVDFYEYLAGRIDTTGYSELQRLYLTKEVEKQYRSFLKFLHPTHYFESKINLACMIGLNDSKPLNILDVGSGAGHFLCIAEFFGHNAMGLDLSDDELKKGDLPHPYKAMCDFFGVKREFGRIQSNGVIPQLENGPFNLVTAFLPGFNSHQNRDPWDNETWDTFFQGVSESWLSEGGRFFFQFIRGKMDEKSWDYFREKSDWMDFNASQVLLNF